MKLLDSRRLTGPNLLWNLEGAVLDVSLSDEEAAPVTDAWIRHAGRILNVHPALLPAFGGSGMYGIRVHQAVIDHGCKVSGCTVHFVDANYDTGPIILQRTCPVLDEDTADTLAARVF